MPIKVYVMPFLSKVRIRFMYITITWLESGFLCARIDIHQLSFVTAGVHKGFLVGRVGVESTCFGRIFT